MSGVDVAVVRIVGGYRSWHDGIDAVLGSGVLTVVSAASRHPMPI
jgi:cobaltochelatase CobN